MRTLGQTMAKLRRMAADFQNQFNEAMREAELADLKKDAEKLMIESATSAVTVTIRSKRRRGIAKDGRGTPALVAESAQRRTSAAAAARARPPNPLSNRRRRARARAERRRAARDDAARTTSRPRRRRSSIA